MRDGLARLLAPFMPVGKDGADARALWSKLAEAGWLAVAVPEAHGGMGLTSDGIGIVMAELGRVAAPVPYLECAVLAVDLVAGLAPPQRAEALLGAMAAGTRVLAPALEENMWRAGGGPVRTEAVATPAGVRLRGAKRLVRGAELADAFIVEAVDVNGDPGLYVVEAGAEGLTVETYDTVDHRVAADLTLADVAVAEGMALTGVAVAGVIERARRRAIAVLCCDAVGAMERLCATTSAYVEERHQFGRKLSANQAVEHKIARMSVAAEEARGAALLATIKAEADDAPAWAAVSAAKAKVGAASRFVAQNAVQLHGGMGVSEELSVHRYFRRLFAFEQTFGTTDSHLAAVADRLRDDVASADLMDLATPAPEAAAERMDLTLSSEDAAFRSEVRGFLDHALTPDLARAQRLNPSFFSEPDVNRAWHKALHEKGWSAPYYPPADGGTGWSDTQSYIFASELAKAGAPLLQGQGLRMVGPVLLKYGTDEQKARFLPGILSGEDYWCQGFSEPGAGSDLAALQTRAVRDGDEYVLNGTKIWTSHAHFADKIFCLVRTADTPKRQDGISFVVFDMDLPGISIQPIITMDGQHEVNQVFFDDVRIPVANRIGAENEGWAVAKYLLEFERGSVSGPYLRATLNTVLKVAAAKRDGNGSALDSPYVGRRLAEIAADLDAYQMMELGLVATLQSGRSPGVAASIAKLRGSEIRQALSETMTDVLGPDALRFHKPRPLNRLAIEDPIEQARAVATPRYLTERVYTIFGGASEVQLTIIGRAVLREAT